MARKPKIAFVVRLTLPEGATMEDARNYIDDAVSAWHGSLEPPNEDNDWTGDPMQALDGETVTVKPYREVK